MTQLPVSPSHQSVSSTSEVNVANATLGGRETSKTILYVGNLAKSVSEDQLKDIIQAAGPVVSVKILQDKNKYEFNYAFVEFESELSAAEALLSFNNTSINGHDVRINYAYQSSTFTSSQNVDGKLFSIFVGDLSLEVNDELLHQFFSEFSSLRQAHVMWDMQTSRSRGYGFATFLDAADAQNAIHTMNGRVLMGRSVRLNWASHKLSVQRGQKGAFKKFRQLPHQQQHLYQQQILLYQQHPPPGTGYDFSYTNSQDIPFDSNYGYGNGGYGPPMLNENYGTVYGGVFNGGFSENPALSFSGSYPDGFQPGIKYGDVAPSSGYTPSIATGGGAVDGYSEFSSPPTTGSGEVVASSSEDGTGFVGGNGSVDAVVGGVVDGSGISGTGSSGGGVIGEPTLAPQFDVAARQAPNWQTTVYVGNIAYYTQETDLYPLLQNFGYIHDLKFYPEKGCAFVKFDTHERAALAIVQLAGFNLNGRPLKCGWGKSRPPQSNYAGFSPMGGAAAQMFSGRQ